MNGEGSHTLERTRSKDFDVLRFQAGESVVGYSVPLKKIRFEDIALRPTELTPIKPEKPHQPIHHKEKIEVKKPEAEIVVPKEKTEEKIFTVPQTLLKYLDTLIIEEKRPLNALRWDVSESKREKEVEDLISGSKLSSDEKKKALDLLNSHSLNTMINSDVLEKLSLAREEYVSELVPYLSKVKEDKKSYEKLMSSLGTNREMPKKDEPKELVSTKKEYFSLKTQALKTMPQESRIDEAEKLWQSIIDSFSSKKYLNKAVMLLDKSNEDDKEQVSLALANNINLLSYSNPKSSPAYDGLRVENPKDKKVEAFFQKKEIEVKPQPEDKLENKPEVKIFGVEPETKVKIEVKETPKVESSATPPPEAYVLPPQDKSVNLDFLGKIIQVISRPDKTVSVLLSGVEIASGTVSPKGAEVKILPQYKSGWLLDKTPEEKALDFAKPTIKTLKI
jgi:hypothetical protein